MNNEYTGCPKKSTPLIEFLVRF